MKKRKKKVCLLYQKTTSCFAVLDLGRVHDLGRVRGPSHGHGLDRADLVTILALVTVVVVEISKREEF